MIDYDPELWDRVMNINVKGTWLISKACVPHLKQSAAGKVLMLRQIQHFGVRQT